MEVYVDLDFSEDKPSDKCRLLVKVNNKNIEIGDIKANEAQIGAEFYYQCKLLKLGIYMEFIHENCRFDAVLVRNNKIILIVEFKNNSPDNEFWINKQGRQFRKYSKYGVDILYITNYSQIKEAVEVAEQYWHD
jgi:hypothetical protein